MGGVLWPQGGWINNRSWVTRSKDTNICQYIQLQWVIQLLHKPANGQWFIQSEDCSPSSQSTTMTNGLQSNPVSLQSIINCVLWSQHVIELSIPLPVNVIVMHVYMITSLPGLLQAEAFNTALLGTCTYQWKTVINGEVWLCIKTSRWMVYLHPYSLPSCTNPNPPLRYFLTSLSSMLEW